MFLSLCWSLLLPSLLLSTTYMNWAVVFCRNSSVQGIEYQSPATRINVRWRELISGTTNRPTAVWEKGGEPRRSLVLDGVGGERPRQSSPTSLPWRRGIMAHTRRLRWLNVTHPAGSSDGACSPSSRGRGDARSPRRRRGALSQGEGRSCELMSFLTVH